MIINIMFQRYFGCPLKRPVSTHHNQYDVQRKESSLSVTSINFIVLSLTVSVDLNLQLFLWRLTSQSRSRSFISSRNLFCSISVRAVISMVIFCTRSGFTSLNLCKQAKVVILVLFILIDLWCSMNLWSTSKLLPRRKISYQSWNWSDTE